MSDQQSGITVDISAVSDQPSVDEVWNDEIINPRLFKVVVGKVRMMHRPKYYTVQLYGMGRHVGSSRQFKRFGDALEFGRRVKAYLVRRYDRAVERLMAGVDAPIPAPATEA